MAKQKVFDWYTFLTKKVLNMLRVYRDGLTELERVEVDYIHTGIDQHAPLGVTAAVDPCQGAVGVNGLDHFIEKGDNVIALHGYVSGTAEA